MHESSDLFGRVCLFTLNEAYAPSIWAGEQQAVMQLKIKNKCYSLT